MVIGSIAAGIQGPAVAAGSWFAFCQSAAAGGYAAAAVATGGQAVAAATAAVILSESNDGIGPDGDGDTPQPGTPA